MENSDLSARLAPLRRYLPPIGSWEAGLYALGFLSLAALVRLPLDDAVNARLPPFLTIYPAVVLASFAGGLRIGAITALAGGVMAYLLWAAPYGWEIPTYAAITASAYLLAVGVTVATAGLARHMLDACVALEGRRSREAAETVHRIKNLIAVVQALSIKIAGQTPDKDAFLERLHERLHALAAAQNVLVRTQFKPANIRDVVESALAPFRDNPRFTLRAGPDIIVPAALVSGLTMALYELATNALKYGALGSDESEAMLSWRAEGGRNKVEWRENAPALNRGAPGLGSSLINGALTAMAETRVTYTLRDGVVFCLFEWPAASG